MKKIIKIAFLLFFCSTVARAQTTAEQRLLSTSGGQANTAFGNVSWTVGEVAVFSSGGENRYGLGMQSYPIFLTPTVNFDTVADKGWGDAPFLLNAQAVFAGNPTGQTVSFSTSTPLLINITGNTVTISSVGTAVITASVAGNGIYLPAESTIAFNIDLVTCPGGRPAVPTISAPNNALCTGTGYLLTAVGTGYSKYQWYLNDFVLVGDTLPTYDPVSDGVYKVKVFHSANECTSESAPFNVTLGTGVSAPSITASGEPTNLLTASGGQNYQWYAYNRLIVNATAEELKIRYNGTYFVEARYPNGCVLRSNPITINSADYVDILRGNVSYNDSVIVIQELLHEPFSKFKATPNPFNEKLNVSYFSSSEQSVRMELYSVSGQLVGVELNYPNDEGFISQEFDTRALPAGIYLLKVTEGKQVKVVKLVKLK